MHVSGVTARQHRILPPASSNGAAKLRMLTEAYVSTAAHDSDPMAWDSL